MFQVVCTGIDIKQKNANLLNDCVYVISIMNLEAKLGQKYGKMPEIVLKFDLLTPKSQLKNLLFILIQ